MYTLLICFSDATQRSGGFEMKKVITPIKVLSFVVSISCHKRPLEFWTVGNMEYFGRYVTYYLRNFTRVRGIEFSTRK